MQDSMSRPSCTSISTKVRRDITAVLVGPDGCELQDSFRRTCLEWCEPPGQLGQPQVTFRLSCRSSKVHVNFVAMEMMCPALRWIRVKHAIERMVRGLGLKCRPVQFPLSRTSSRVWGNLL